MKKDTKLELPMWMARTLASKKIVRVDMPKSFNQKMVGSLKADPLAVTLASAPYFYELGLNISSLYVYHLG